MSYTEKLILLKEKCELALTPTIEIENIIDDVLFLGTSEPNKEQIQKDNKIFLLLLNQTEILTLTDFKNNNAVWLAGITGHSTIILYDESVNNLVYVKALLLTPLQLNFKIKTIDEKLDDYFLKLDEIKSISVNPNSTLDNLKQSIEDYSLFSNDINETLGNTIEMKIIKYQLDRNRKDILHSSLLKTVEIKKASMTEYQQNHTYSETMTFSSSINELSQYCNNVIDSCDCMKNRKEIIEKKGQLY